MYIIHYNLEKYIQFLYKISIVFLCNILLFLCHGLFQVELKEGEETLDSNGDTEDRQSDEKEEGEVRSGAKTPPNPGPPQSSKKEFDLDAYLHNKCQFCGFIAK